MFSDPSFWVDIALLILVVGFFALGAHKKITKALDDRSERIRAELDEARQLREEANALLAKYERQKRAAEETAKTIVANAQRDAEAQLEKARKDIEQRADARIKAMEQKIQTAQAEVVKQLRHDAIDQAFDAVREVLGKDLTKTQAKAYNDKAISALEGKLH